MKTVYKKKNNKIGENSIYHIRKMVPEKGCGKRVKEKKS